MGEVVDKLLQIERKPLQQKNAQINRRQIKKNTLDGF
jgi:hypothetical protein